MASDRRALAPPPPLVVVASWLVPGAGYWLLGQRARGTAIGISVLCLFVLGMLIGGITVVDAPLSLAQISAKPWFVAQILTGPVSIAAAWLAGSVDVVSHSRSFEIGTLYTAVAGMLNLLGIIDAGYRAANESP
jgi:hypothetical protein